MKRTTNITSPQPVILTMDPSITAWGWAIVTPGGEVLEAGCIKTAPEHKKARIRKGDDTVRRLTEVVATLVDLTKKHNIKLILTEQPHGSQSASAAIMVGAVTALTVGAFYVLNIGVEWYSEADGKKAVLGGKTNTTKRDMINAINQLYDVPWTGVQYRDEAVADAMAIFHAATRYSVVLKTLS